LAIKALINAVANVFNVLVISVLFYLLMGIIGVNYFKGQFSYCVLDQTGWPEVNQQGTLFYKWDCLNFGGEWDARKYKFDNIVESMMTLFQMSTLSDWLNVMYDGMSITGIESDFILKNSPFSAIYFVIFVVVGAFFTLNLFVGVVISTYNREKEKIAKDFLLKERQKEWLYAKQIIFRQKL
jgi:Ion transport protein